MMSFPFAILKCVCFRFAAVLTVLTFSNKLIFNSFENAVLCKNKNTKERPLYKLYETDDKIKDRRNWFCANLQNPEQRKAVSFFTQKCLLVSREVWLTNFV